MNLPMSNPPKPHRDVEVAHADELALLVDAVQDYAMFILSPTGEIRSWNRGAGRLMGYKADEIIGSNFSTFYSEADLAARKPQRELETAADEGRVEDEGWRIRKDGTRFWANTVITALRNADGSLRGFAKVTRDLSERREAEERLRQNEEMFRLLVSSVRDYAIFMLDSTGHIATWNEGARRIKQYAPEEIIGKHFSVFYPPEDKWKPAKELEIAIREGSVEDEGWRVRKDGTRFWANVVITAVRDAAGELRGFAKVTRDITEKREAEETRLALIEQREARIQAEEEKRRAEASFQASQEANRAKDEFLMTLSHELRTPMTAILGWARMLPTMNSSDRMFGEAVAAIARSAKLQAQLIDDVLDVSRIVSGKLRLTLETRDVAPVLLSALDSVRPSAQAKGIGIETKIDDDIGAVTFDPTRLQQIVWNLLSNAVKFTPKGGHIELSANLTDSQLCIAVTDSGEGIDPKFLPHVFEPFRQAESASTRVHGGLGLGLSIVRYLAEAHGGRVSAESEGRGHGARFRVDLPIRPISTSDGEAPRVAHPEVPDTPRQPTLLAGCRVVVVDDDNEGREMIVMALRHAGATVDAFNSGSSALEYLESNRPDLILTDIAMPEMDGYAFEREVRQRADLAGVPIVALTAFPASVTGGDTEFDTYLRKPIDPYDLAERLKDVLTAN
jgi:PAS domain S-box-containing protein